MLQVLNRPRSQVRTWRRFNCYDQARDHARSQSHWGRMYLTQSGWEQYDVTSERPTSGQVLGVYAAGHAVSEKPRRVAFV